MRADIEILLEQFRKVQPDIFDEYGKIHPNLPSLPFQMAAMLELINRMEENLKENEYFKTTVSGLWAIDKNPKEVTKEWIENNAFQI